MNFDPAITQFLSDFVQADQAERDYDKAALVLLRISGNKMRYNAMLRNLDRYKEVIDRELAKYLEFRLAKITREQVDRMQTEANAIVAKSEKTESRIAAGKRPDHDNLPDDVKAAYAETLDILRKQRKLHAAISTLALAQSSCPSSEIYPFVKEIIELDKKRLALWRVYDDFGQETDQN